MPTTDSDRLRSRLKKRRAHHVSALRTEAIRLAGEAAKMGAQRVVLFGSVAKGDPGLASDIDLLIIIESSRDYIDRIADAYQRLKPKVPADILVYTPNEIKKMENNPLIKRAVSEGQVLYEA